MYVVKRATQAPSLNGEPQCPVWMAADTLWLEHFHAKSSTHRPRVSARVLYGDDELYLYFLIEDRYIRSIRTTYQASVCRDSCVEWFVRPKPDKGYFNFEINAGGTLLLYYISDAGRTAKGFKEWQPVDWEHAKLAEIHTSLPETVEPEITEPLTWWMKARIPLALFEAYVGPIGDLSGQTWHANFYKCADETSHPHWASWQEVGDPLDFHKPHCFGPITFA